MHPFSAPFLVFQLISIKNFTTDPFSSFFRYFDVYSPLISTVYGQVYWTVMDAVALPDDIVKRFDNKTMVSISPFSFSVFLLSFFLFFLFSPFLFKYIMCRPFSGTSRTK